MPIQNALGSIPVVDVSPPPEGKMAASFSIVLTPSEPSIAQAFQLNSPGGLSLSQVVTLVIDNTSNAYSVQVIHGAMNEICVVSAGSTVIIPTFSNKGSYPINVSLAPQSGIIPVPALNIEVDVVFLNYARSPGTFNSGSQSSIIGNLQNTTTLVSVFEIFNPVSAPPSFSLTPIGNYVLTEIDVGVDGANITAAGVGSFEWQIGYVDTPVFLPIVSGRFIGFATAAAQWCAPLGGRVHVSFPQGLPLPRNDEIFFNVQSGANVGNASMSINIYGLNTP
jgi:hypothetical protein